MPPGSVMRPIVIWALETPMRQDEVLALEARSIRGNVAYLRDTKTTRARSVALSTRALRVLDGLPVPLRGPLFPITQDSLEYFWRKALRIAGIAGLRFQPVGLGDSWLYRSRSGYLAAPAEPHSSGLTQSVEDPRDQAATGLLGLVR